MAARRTLFQAVGQLGLASGLELGLPLFHVSSYSSWTSSSLRRICLWQSTGVREYNPGFRLLLESRQLTVHGPKEITGPGSKSVGQKNMLYPMRIYISSPRKRIFLTQIQYIPYCLCNTMGRVLSLLSTWYMLSLCTEGVCISQMLCRIETEAYYKLSNRASVFINKI